MTTTPTPISDYLRAAVERSGLTPYAISHAAGIHRQLVGRWLKGERDLTLGTADRIAAGLGLTLPAPAKNKSRKSDVPN